LIAAVGRLPALYQNGHRYFQAVEWISPKRLHFSVRAYDGTPGQEYQATFVLDVETRAVQKVEE
jgi:hypothetical protein